MKLYEFEMPLSQGTCRGIANNLQEAAEKACTGSLFRPIETGDDEEFFEEIDLKNKYTDRIYPVRFRSMPLDF